MGGGKWEHRRNTLGALEGEAFSHTGSTGETPGLCWGGGSDSPPPQVTPPPSGGLQAPNVRNRKCRGLRCHGDTAFSAPPPRPPAVLTHPESPGSSLTSSGRRSQSRAAGEKARRPGLTPHSTPPPNTYEATPSSKMAAWAEPAGGAALVAPQWSRRSHKGGVVRRCGRSGRGSVTLADRRPPWRRGRSAAGLCSLG